MRLVLEPFFYTKDCNGINGLLERCKSVRQKLAQIAPLAHAFGFGEEAIFYIAMNYIMAPVPRITKAEKRSLFRRADAFMKAPPDGNLALDWMEYADHLSG